MNHHHLLDLPSLPHSACTARFHECITCFQVIVFNHQRIGLQVKYQEQAKMCVCVCVCVRTPHTDKQAPGSAPTHSLRATYTVRWEQVSDFVEEQWKQTVKTQSFSLVWTRERNSVKSCSIIRRLVCNEQEFLWPPPLWPALTLTNKHSSQVVRTWSVHYVYLVFVWFTPEFMRLHLNIMKNDQSTCYSSVQHETWH